MNPEIKEMSLKDAYCYMLDQEIYYLNVDRETFIRLSADAKPLIHSGDCGEFGLYMDGRTITSLRPGQAYFCDGVPGVCLECPQKSGSSDHLILTRYQGGDPLNADSWSSYFSGSSWSTVTAIDATIEDVLRDRYQIFIESEGWPKLIVGEDNAKELIGKFLAPRVYFNTSFYETWEHVLNKASMLYLRSCAALVDEKSGSWSLSILDTLYNEKCVRTLISHKGRWYIQTIRNKEAKDKQREIYLWNDPYVDHVREIFERYGFRNDNDESEVDHA